MNRIWSCLRRALRLIWEVLSLPMALWHLWKTGNLKERVPALQTIVLTITLLGVGWYAYLTHGLLGESQKQGKKIESLVKEARKQSSAAQTSARAALAQVEVARYVTVGAGIVVSDPILTVSQFAKQHKVHDVLKEKWGNVADDRLMIEITNEGVGAAMNVKVTAKWPPHDGKGNEPDEQGWMPSIGRGEKWDADSLFFSKAPGVAPEKRKPWEDGLSRDAWRIWRLKPGDQALLYFTEPDGEKKCTLELTWHDVFYRHEPPVPIKVVWHKGHWYTDWGEAAKLWQARVKQMIGEMEQIANEIGK